MNESQQISRQQFIESMRQQIESTMDQVVEAVNAAPDGAWINASEQPVRDAFARLRQAAYGQALQMRIEATESSFSPGEEPGDSPATAEQRARHLYPTDHQRPGEVTPTSLV